MNWKAQNEAPVGYEPTYSVVETTTGRDIALNLIEEEALKIENCEEAFYHLKDLVEIFDKLYTNTNIKDDSFLEYANGLILNAEKLLTKVRM